MNDINHSRMGMSLLISTIFKALTRQFIKLRMAIKNWRIDRVDLFLGWARLD